MKYWLLFFLLEIPFLIRAEKDSVTTVSIKILGGLQFDVVRFSVKPGEKVNIVVSNDDDMDHNLVIVKPGKREKIVEEAILLGGKGPRQNYVPLSSDVLWATPLLSPDQIGTLSFTAPKQPGIYPYVCTYPGHGFVMYGAMYVTDAAMPDMTTDLNIPEIRRNNEKPIANEEHKNHVSKPAQAHPYISEPPVMYRVFMPDASPASIAVNLPGNISYCWDAGTCRLRYAWSGGFIDNSKSWNVKGDAQAKIEGEIFYRDLTTFPFRVGDNYEKPVFEYKGYKLIQKYPEFHYTINGQDVFELIKEKKEGEGLIRIFRIPENKETIWFLTDPADRVDYQISTGKPENGKFRFSPENAKSFTITMTRK